MVPYLARQLAHGRDGMGRGERMAVVFQDRHNFDEDYLESCGL